MATFGFTGIGGSTRGWSNTFPALMHLDSSLHYTPSSDETLEELWIYMARASVGTRTIEFGVYDITAGTSVPDVIYVGSVNVSITALNGFPAWHSSLGLSINLTGGNTYALASTSSLEAGGVVFYYDVLASGGTQLTGGSAGVLPSPTTGTNGAPRNEKYSMYAVTAAAGPTLTGPASAQEGDAINAIGTGLTNATLDLVTTVGGHVGAQVTTGTPTDTMWPYTVNPKTGVPFSVVDIQAAGVTLWVTEQEATDGTSATSTMTIAAKTNETVIQGMIATSNTTPGESIFGTNILAMQDNLQANAPTLVDGVTITWFADGTFTVDINQAISFTVDFFSPSNSEWQSISLNITEAGEITISAANKLTLGIGIGI